jgi:adenylate kinase
MLQTVIFIGRSGSGKGVQSAHLQEYLKGKYPETPTLYIEMGDYFRKYIKSDGLTWERAREVNQVGGRQPSFLAVWVWSEIFIEKLTGNEHLVFDGTPRSVEEARLLDTAFPFYRRENPTVVFLNVSRTWAEARLAGRGRADDVNPEVVKRRLEFYEQDVVPAIEYYRASSNYRFLDINGEQTPAKVFEDIVAGLDIK